MLRKLLWVLVSFSTFSALANEVNIYSYRQPFLIEPVVEAFTKQTGVKVNVVFAKKGLVERLKREGKYTEADLVMTTDISRLVELVDQGLSQPVDNKVIEGNIPSQYRDPDDHWFALTLRVRNVYTDKEMGNVDISYEDLADEKYEGKICTRSGKHPYNIALVASMIAHHGEAKTKQWLEGVKANLARRPQGNDRGQVKAIYEGLCAVSLGNSYYFGKMINDKKQKRWADSVNINFPNQKNRGAHVNVSGVVLTKYAPNKQNAIKLMEFLSGSHAQKIYAEVNMEYPVKTDVEPSELVKSWGEFKADSLSVAEIAKYRPLALKLVDQVKFDL